jgi:hypothetical protein
MEMNSQESNRLDDRALQNTGITLVECIEALEILSQSSANVDELRAANDSIARASGLTNDVPMTRKTGSRQCTTCDYYANSPHVLCLVNPTHVSGEVCPDYVKEAMPTGDYRDHIIVVPIVPGDSQ